MIKSPITKTGKGENPKMVVRFTFCSIVYSCNEENFCHIAQSDYHCYYKNHQSLKPSIWL